MERPVRGDLVLVPFPFSNLSGLKRRPALVLAVLPGDDVLLCQVTSKRPEDPWFFPLSSGSLSEGVLKLDSYVRPSVIFTADRSVLIKRLARVREEMLDLAIERAVSVLKGRR